MSFWKKIFGGEKAPISEPFMEHPAGDFDSAVEVMEDAIRRLRGLPRWEQWITFSAQGEGHDDSYQFAEIRILGERMDVGDRPLDVARVLQVAGTGASSLIADGTHYSVAAASPREVAQLMDAIFCHHFGIRPFADEGDDYAVGAKWDSGQEGSAA